MGFELRAPKCLARCSTNWAIWHVRSKLLAVLNYLKSPSIRDQHVRFFPLERVNLSIPGVGHSTKFNGMGGIMNRIGDIMTDQTNAYPGCRISIVMQVLYQLSYLVVSLMIDLIWPSQCIIKHILNINHMIQPTI